MTFGMSSYGDPDYDKRYFYQHFEDEDGDFTTEGYAPPHDDGRVLYRIESVDEVDIDELNAGLDDLELYLATRPRGSSGGPEFQPDYSVGMAVAGAVFVGGFIAFLSCLGFGVYALVRLIR